MAFIKTVTELPRADPRHRAERNLYAIDGLIEYFGEGVPLKDVKVPQLRAYRRARSEKIEHGTSTSEMGVLSAIFRMQMEKEALEVNPCMMMDGA
ncbi:MAG: hypothetical protein HY912_08150 [Desulfomonile tiedjei]|uniref:Uncharacterized protein n=1 Tax=Desulfomonile tiedjei TaxID=2358 RepID=A0A9D6V125_9BACT|nr:hypothetical protein [Desulfomonile tiedjei]